MGARLSAIVRLHQPVAAPKQRRMATTLRIASWLEKSALVLCDVYEEKRDELVPYAPRSILRKQLERAARMGFLPMGASELELYVFRNCRDVHDGPGLVVA